MGHYAYDPDVVVIAVDKAEFFEVCEDLVQSQLSKTLINGYPRAPDDVHLAADASTIGAAAYIHRTMFDTTMIEDIAA